MPNGNDKIVPICIWCDKVIASDSESVRCDDAFGMVNIDRESVGNNCHKDCYDEILNDGSKYEDLTLHYLPLGKFNKLQ